MKWTCQGRIWSGWANLDHLNFSERTYSILIAYHMMLCWVSRLKLESLEQGTCPNFHSHRCYSNQNVHKFLLVWMYSIHYSVPMNQHIYLQKMEKHSIKLQTISSSQNCYPHFWIFLKHDSNRGPRIKPIFETSRVLMKVFL